MEFVDEEIRAHRTDFSQLGSFFYLFKTRWDNNLKLLGAPLEALQVHRRTEAVGRYLSVQFGYNKKSVEKLTRVLYETLKSENDLMKSFQSGEKRLIKDKTNSFVLPRDVTHFMTVNQQCTRKRISLASFFATCFMPPLLSKLHGLLGGPENRTSATPLLTSDTNNGEAQAVNSGFFKRKHAAKIADISALASMSGSKKQYTGGPRPESPEPLGHASDDE
ncbi:uncharacterized protein [Fopius arisanus]|uniref:Uncharacterized protein n=1 Tax=Fopius arisanus TaxID=64838 RepID=A0A9R1T155_9HYME|nr:PREDICTED: uncharacterized protein LOC105265147 [Fopius arisanus]